MLDSQLKKKKKKSQIEQNQSGITIESKKMKMNTRSLKYGQQTIKEKFGLEPEEYCRCDLGLYH